MCFERFQALGPLQIDSARRADYFGSGISFWNALSVDIDALLVSETFVFASVS